jgi:hypothetical protein
MIRFFRAKFGAIARLVPFDFTGAVSVPEARVGLDGSVHCPERDAQGVGVDGYRCPMRKIPHGTL